MRLSHGDDERIDLDGIHLYRSLVDGHGCVVAAARTENQDTARDPAQKAIGQVVTVAEGDVVGPGQQVASLQRRGVLVLRTIRQHEKSGVARQIDARQGVVRTVGVGAIGPGNDGEDRARRECAGKDPHAGSPQHDKRRGKRDGEPDQRRGIEKREQGEDDRAEKGTGEIAGIAGERVAAIAEPAQPDGDQLSQRNERGGGQDKRDEDRRRDAVHYGRPFRQVVVEEPEMLGHRFRGEGDAAERPAGAGDDKK